MKLGFRSLAILTALVFFALALTWMFAPYLLLSSWGVELTPADGLVGQRSAALYAGIGAMFFLARNAQPSPARSALLAGAVVTCLALAALGVFDFATGRAEAGILVAVFIEIALTVAFLTVRFTELLTSQPLPKTPTHSTGNQG